MISEKQSKTLYIVRAFAVLSVIAAHMPFGREHLIADSVRISLGQIGVVIFFILSGFFYKRKDGDIKEFWLKKLKNIVIPWFIISIITYIISCLLTKKADFLPVSIIKWVFGVQNWYWYLPVLLVLFALFKYIKKDALLYLIMGITVASVLLSAFGIIKYNMYFNQHFNIFNWAGFFALGLLIRKKDLLDKLSGVIPLIVSCVLLILSVLLTVKMGQAKAYIDYFSLLCELCGFVFVLNLSGYLYKINILKDIGAKSFFIYLIQMQIAGIINTRLPYNAFFFIIRPFSVLILIYIICLLIEFVLTKTKLKKYDYIIGLK